MELQAWCSGFRKTGESAVLLVWSRSIKVSIVKPALGLTGDPIRSRAAAGRVLGRLCPGLTHAEVCVWGAHWARWTPPSWSQLLIIHCLGVTVFDWRAGCLFPLSMCLLCQNVMINPPHLLCIGQCPPKGETEKGFGYVRVNRSGNHFKRSDPELCHIVKQMPNTRVHLKVSPQSRSQWLSCFQGNWN